MSQLCEAEIAKVPHPIFKLSVGKHRRQERRRSRQRLQAGPRAHSRPADRERHARPALKGKSYENLNIIIADSFKPPYRLIFNRYHPPRTTSFLDSRAMSVKPRSSSKRSARSTQSSASTRLVMSALAACSVHSRATTGMPRSLPSSKTSSRRWQLKSLTATMFRLFLTDTISSERYARSMEVATPSRFGTTFAG